MTRTTFLSAVTLLAASTASDQNGPNFPW